MLDNLTKDVLAAEREGMSYGQWKATHPHTKPVTKRKVRDEDGKIYRQCRVCGAKFEVKYPHHQLCSDACRVINQNLLNQRYQKARAAKMQERKEG